MLYYYYNFIFKSSNFKRSVATVLSTGNALLTAVVTLLVRAHSKNKIELGIKLHSFRIES